MKRCERCAQLEEALVRLRRLAVTRDDGEMIAVIDEVSDAALRRWADTTEEEQMSNSVEGLFIEELKAEVREQATELVALRAENERLRGALADAASSLSALSNAGGRHDPGLADMIDVRGYAHSRAAVARRALAGDTEEPTDE